MLSPRLEIPFPLEAGQRALVGDPLEFRETPTGGHEFGIGLIATLTGAPFGWFILHGVAFCFVPAPPR